MLQEIEALRQKFREELDSAATPAELEPIRVAYLGKKGPIQELMKGLKDMTDAQRREAGQLVNTLKSELAEAIII
jgi:phenylalanyl-tRNA synthetase alpha chain